MQNIFDFIGYLKDWCTENKVFLIAGPESYQNAVADEHIYEDYDLIMCASLTINPMFTETGANSCSYNGSIGFGRKREITDSENTVSNLDETFDQKYERRLLDLTETLVAFLEDLQCNEDADIRSCIINYSLNRYDLNADFVIADVSLQFDK